MPEYLSPAVYLEEVSTGPRPIEGVSTSTCGMVGVTERGPENVPVLVTSIGDYRRVFGSELAYGDFTNAGRVHGHTFHAVRAFFENGGRRNYVVRVASVNAALAERALFDRGGPGSADTLLLRDAPRDSGTGLNPPLVYALGANPPAVNDTIRIDDGSRAEYREVVAIGNTVHVPLAAPLSLSHTAPVAADEVAITPDGAYAGAFSLTGDEDAGSAELLLTLTAAADGAIMAALAAGAPFQIGALPRAEFVAITGATDLGGGQVRLTLTAPTRFDHVAAEAVTPLDPAAAVVTGQALGTNASAGDSLIFLDALGGGFAAGNLVVIDPGTANAEVRLIGTFAALTLDPPAYMDYDEGARIDLVTMADDDRQVLNPGGALAPTATAFVVDAIDGLAAGMSVDVNGDIGVIDAIDDTTDQLTLRAALPGGAPAAGDPVIPVAKRTTAAAAAGDIVIALNNRLGLQPDDVLRLGAADPEFVTVAAVMEPRGVAPDAGNVLLTAPLRQAHAANSEVRRQHPPEVNAARQPAFAVIGAPEGAAVVHVTDGAGYAANDIVSVTLAGDVQLFHTLSAVDNALAPVELELDDTLDLNHEMGAALVGRDALIHIVALDRGRWGNRLRIAVAEPETPLVQASLTGSSALNPLISLGNYTGVEIGTVLEFFDPATGAQVGDLAKVIRVDRAAGEVELAAIPDPAVTGAAIPLSVRSREFRLQVFLLQRPDPAVPSRNDTVIDSEEFLVTMDPRHSLYLHRVIGTTWNPINDEDDDGVPLRAWDRRSEGASRYVRVRDLAAGNPAVSESIRLGPEPLEDILVNGNVQPARLPLALGRDGVFSMNDAMYRGVDSNEPRLRTGIHALRNQDDISIVAVPGQVTERVQQALINHCEQDRYRFAVLDGPPPNGDTLVDVQLQRQQFDTNYAALYHPWVTIPDPLPGNLASIQQVPLPPSGYVTGIFARTDNERGVHKAPANEVVRNITGLSRYLNQREQDILNPFPTNINVIRDFRRQNRGIRVWGARCITSDSQYKYVPVRRLLIFIEASIDRGLQWVVFEPNAEPLWARVRRSIANFLTVVWRNGALEGISPEQAFFVKCDRTTMTQTDIDNGRLICLVGVAPVKPAEFVIVRIGLKTATAEA